eukprot:765840-Hanusia_phi.AAC.2
MERHQPPRLLPQSSCHPVAPQARPRVLPVLPVHRLRVHHPLAARPRVQEEQKPRPLLLRVVDHGVKRIPPHLLVSQQRLLPLPPPSPLLPPRRLVQPQHRLRRPARRACDHQPPPPPSRPLRLEHKRPAQVPALPQHHPLVLEAAQPVPADGQPDLASLAVVVEHLHEEVPRPPASLDQERIRHVQAAHVGDVTASEDGRGLGGAGEGVGEGGT